MTSTSAPQTHSGTPSHTAAAWPQAGSPEFHAVPLEWRMATAAHLEADLRRHAVDTWFPRCVDTADGGFLCDFDRRWRPAGAQHRMLEFQARQTRTAARLGLAYPSEQEWRDIALHGLRYLRSAMHDQENAGWFWLVDRSGRALAGGTKHAHGTAYMIDAGVEVYRLTGDPSALELAQAGLAWLDRSLADSVHGGYHGWATRDGRPILNVQDAPDEYRATGRDPLGHGIGLKDANVHSDVMEALTLVCEVVPSPGNRSALSDIFRIVTKRFITAHGSMHYLAYPDLTPVPTIERFGYPLQTAWRIPMAAHALGLSPADAITRASSIVEHILGVAWDDTSDGFVEAGPAAAPYELSGSALRTSLRPWWVQTEGLKILLFLTVAGDGGDRYRSLFERVLAVIDRDFLDHRDGGWLVAGRRRSWRDAYRARGLPKGDMWKDASHETDFYLNAIRMLRGIAPNRPLNDH